MANGSRTRLLLAAGLPALAAMAPAMAATSTTTFIVQVVITADCTVTAGSLNFGSLGLISANVDAASTITATCTSGTAYNVGLDAGNVAGSTIAARQLASGSNKLGFQVYRDTSRTQVWGSTIGTDTVSGTGNGAAQNYSVFGRIAPPTPAPAPGTYTSTITVTVTY